MERGQKPDDHATDYRAAIPDEWSGYPYRRTRQC